MLFLFAGVLYITFSSWLTGHWLLQKIKVNSRFQHSLTANLLSGICLLAFVAGVWTLLLPTKYDMQHLVLTSCCIAYWTTTMPKLTLQVQFSKLGKLSMAEKTLLILASSLLLIMGSWEITHPDTLGYHADIISWIDQYRAVPGLANIQLRLGYQGQWFPLCSFLSPHIPGLDTINLLNTTLCVWFLLFVAEKMGETKNASRKTVWLVMLAVTLSSYTQLRLSVTSASPDFIATLLVWWVFYEVFHHKHSTRDLILLLLVCITAITVKLSVIFSFFFLGYYLFNLLRSKQWVMLTQVFVFSLTLTLPFLLRNIITTGYLVFPLPSTGISYLDWMVPKATVALDQSYIKAYARSKATYDQKIIETINNLSWQEWIPNWWRNQSLADQVILSFCILSLLLYFFRPRQSLKHLTIWLAAFSGLVFWFTMAPDPRFGFGYIIPLLSLLYPSQLEQSRLAQKTGTFFLYSLIFMCSAYSGYRLLNFFHWKHLLVPAGIQQPPHKQTPCKGVNWKLVDKEKGCMGLSAPCTSLPCAEIIPRGKQITDGFSPR